MNIIVALHSSPVVEVLSPRENPKQVFLSTSAQSVLSLNLNRLEVLKGKQVCL